MNIGIDLSDNLRVSLGDLKEKLVEQLNMQMIKYTIPYDKINRHGVKETIIQIESLSTEISIENGKVVYIKSSNNDYTHLLKLNTNLDVNVSDVRNIHKIINEKFSLNDKQSDIERLDLRTMNMSFIIKAGSDRIRLHILKDALGNVYINTLRKV